MAYKRELPTFNKEPEPKLIRTQVVNPDQSVTYKQSWSSETPGKSSSKKAMPAKKVSSDRSTPPIKTAGQREVTSIPPIKTAGRTDTEITASAKPKAVTPNIPETPQESRLRRYGPVGERVYGKGSKKEKWQGSGDGSGSKNKSGSCRNC